MFIKISRLPVMAIYVAGFIIECFAIEPFQEISEQAGITHQHNGFFYGGGAACSDFNNDGFTDIYIPMGEGYRNRLFLNNGNLTFSETAWIAGVADPYSEGFAAIAADFNNDGNTDIYVANHMMANRLFLNNGNASFIDATNLTGTGDPGPATSVAAADFDRDGWLDIFVLNRTPTRSDYHNKLFHNNGDGTFTDVTITAGLDYYGTCLGVIFTDLNEDGLPDIYIANEFEVDCLYLNNGDSTFTNVAGKINLPLGEGMGVDLLDYNNDGTPDIYVTNYLHDFLLENNGDSTFTDVAATAGIANTSIGWGINPFDYDNDGDTDLYIVNGAMTYTPRAENNLLYQNNGQGVFTDVAKEMGIADSSGDGRGSVIADFNNDGYGDLFVINVLRGTSRLFINPGGGNNWLTLRLTGTVSNKTAIGARAIVYTSDSRQIKNIRGGSGYASMHSTDLMFGLGGHSLVDSILIVWPSGLRQKLIGVSANQILEVMESATTTSLKKNETILPEIFTLLPNYPNPFNNETVISYRLPETGQTVLTVFNVAGQKIYRHNSGMQSPGTHRWRWNGRDEQGGDMPSGIYFYQIDFHSNSGILQRRSGKMLLVK